MSEGIKSVETTLWSSCNFRHVANSRSIWPICIYSIETGEVKTAYNFAVESASANSAASSSNAATASANAAAAAAAATEADDAEDGVDEPLDLQVAGEINEGKRLSEQRRNRRKKGRKKGMQKSPHTDRM